MVEKLPKVSIVISTYNRAKYLSDAIESALAQDYLNLEVVVFDALSTDETQEVVRRYQEDRLKYVKHKAKLAAHQAIQKAVYEHSTGDWVLIISDDDYLVDSSYISNAMSLAKKDDKTIFIHANYKYYFAKTGKCLEIRQHLPEIADGKWYFFNWGDDQRSIRIPWQGVQPTETRRVSQVYDASLHARWTPADPRGPHQIGLSVLASGPLKPWIEICLINKHLLGDIVLYDSEIISCDYADLLRMCLRGKVGFLNDTVGVYRVHENNANAHRSVARVIENFQCIIIPYEYAKVNNLLPAKELELWRRKKIKYLSDDMITNFAFKRNSSEMLKGIIKRLKKDYPFALIVLLYPQNMVKLFLFKFPWLFKQVLKMYQIVRCGRVIYR